MYQRSDMMTVAFGALVVEIILFSGIAGVCAWEVITTSPHCVPVLLRLRQLRYRPSQELMAVQQEEAESMSGVSARLSVQGMLIVACLARAGLTFFILLRNIWVPYFALPDLAYLSTYGSLVLFLAQMQQTSAGTRYRIFKFTAWGSLAAVLTVSLIVCTVRWGSDPESPRSVLLRKFLYYELGITYLVLFSAFVYFGSRVCATAYNNRRLFMRVVLLTSVCGLAMSSKGCFFVAAAANAWRTDALFPSAAGRYRFEAIIALDELLPSLAILALTVKGKPRRNASATAESAAFVRYSNSPVFNVGGTSGSMSWSTNTYSYGSGLNQA